MKLIRNVLAAGIVAAATVVACSSQHGAAPGNASNTSPPPLGQTDNTGSVGLNLVTPQGTSIYSINWTISNGTNTYTGTVNLGDAAIQGSIEFVAGGLAAGTGYTLSLVGADSNGDPCSGTSNTFPIVAGADNFVGVNVVCTIPTDAAVASNPNTGSVQVDAGVTFDAQGAYLCPAAQSISILPALGATGGPPLQLSAAQSGGTPGTFFWTTNAPAGSLSSQTGATPTFSCLAVGTFTVTVQVQDNVIPVGLDASTNVCNGVANTTLTGQLNCASTGGCFVPPGDTNCSGDGGCGPFVNTASLQTDPNNCGGCGITCSGATPICQAATCVAPPPVPCTGGTIPNNTPVGCVPCKGSANGVCTPTEQIVLNYDISKHGLLASTVLSGTVAPTAQSQFCYYCAVHAGCLDSPGGTVNGIKALAGSELECEDPLLAGTDVAANNPGECRDALTCVLDSNHCSTTTPGHASTDPTASVSNCYCGTALGTACQTAGNANGVCLTNEQTDLGSTSPATILANFTDATLSPGGVGNAILNCALANSCDVCFF
jgi:hypothetical protein